MTAAASEPAAAARAVALEAAHTYRTRFADRFVAAYVLGSLAHGGYAPAVSDIDLAVILTGADGRDGDTVADAHQALGQGGALYRKLSVFWASLPALRRGHDDGRFPAIDRLDLAEHGRLLLGDEVAGQVAVPTADELLVDSAQFAVKVLVTAEAAPRLAAGIVPLYRRWTEDQTRRLRAAGASAELVAAIADWGRALAQLSTVY